MAKPNPKSTIATIATIPWNENQIPASAEDRHEVVTGINRTATLIVQA